MPLLCGWCSGLSISTSRLVCVTSCYSDGVCLSDRHLTLNVPRNKLMISCPVLLLLKSSSSDRMAIQSSSWSGQTPWCQAQFLSNILYLIHQQILLTLPSPYIQDPTISWTDVATALVQTTITSLGSVQLPPNWSSCFWPCASAVFSHPSSQSNPLKA